MFWRQSNDGADHDHSSVCARHNAGACALGALAVEKVTPQKRLHFRSRFFCALSKIVLAIGIKAFRLLGMEVIINRLKTLETEQIREIIAMMFNDHSQAGEIVFDAALSVLESKMPEADFVSFCETLS